MNYRTVDLHLRSECSKNSRTRPLKSSHQETCPQQDSDRPLRQQQRREDREERAQGVRRFLAEFRSLTARERAERIRSRAHS